MRTASTALLAARSCFSCCASVRMSPDSLDFSERSMRLDVCSCATDSFSRSSWPSSSSLCSLARCTSDEE